MLRSIMAEKDKIMKMKNMAYWKAKNNISPLKKEEDDDKNKNTRTATIGGQTISVTFSDEEIKEQEEAKRKKEEDQERIQREIDGTAEYTPDEQKEKLKKHFKDAKKNKNKK